MPEPKRILTKGLVVRMRREGSSDEWAEGFVELVSPNGQSISVTLVHGMVRGAGGLCGGSIPLAVDYELETVRALWGDEYELEIADA